jgi:hypothetical protein
MAVPPAVKAPGGVEARPTRDKLVIVATDLQTPPFDVDQAAGMFKDAGAHLRVLATEEDAGAPAKRWPLEELADKLLAEKLSGPVVKGKQLAQLADVFAEFVTQARGRAIRAADFAVDADGPAATFGVDLSHAPRLNAYLVCGPQPNTRILARIAATHSSAAADASGDAGQPLLASRQVGLGQSVGLAIPMDDRNNQGWHDVQAWPGAAKLILAAAAAAGAGGDHRFGGVVTPTRDGLHVVLQGSDQNGPINLRKLVLRWQEWDEPAWRQAPLRETGPGKYEAFVRASSATVTLEALEAPGPDASNGSGVAAIGEGPRGPAGAADGVIWRQVVPEHYPREFAAIGGNWDNLRKLAALTGGQIVAQQDLQSLQRRLVQQSQLQLWPILLAAALAVMLAEWAIARVLRE